MMTGLKWRFQDSAQSRAGTLDDLSRWCTREGSKLHIMKPLELGGEVVSSRRIREMVEVGEVDQIIPLLGRPFYLRGGVVKGAARGRQLGFPTLNMIPDNEIIPANGVYATRTRIDGGPPMISVTNIGINPTFAQSRELSPVKVETHVIGRTLIQSLESIDVDFLKRIRAEIKFNSIEDLKMQIQSDILRAQEVSCETLDVTQSEQ